jgi:hypothetical protein
LAFTFQPNIFAAGNWPMPGVKGLWEEVIGIEGALLPGAWDL